MLILTRKIGEEIVIGENILVKVLGVRSGQVKIGVQAPRELPVHRQEVLERIRSGDAGPDAGAPDQACRSPACGN
ncbi:MAG: carbon storage regulator CsrA [Gammaproteobacteria bacterium]|nr:carbon storage regulator CsrA [Gammaproteobacteria bacterium]NIV49683.1 carbon storage regulator CsrA [Gammaproteobacteria bacterium]NIW57081.1 carbon storage regulator CsrA [Gammaproteobacteria bacterium]